MKRYKNSNGSVSCYEAIEVRKENERLKDKLNEAINILIRSSWHGYLGGFMSFEHYYIKPFVEKHTGKKWDDLVNEMKHHYRD